MVKHLSDDVFAVSNPAFCALVLHFFLSGYCEVNSNGADYASVFLPVPLILSNDIRLTMEHTNRSTGVLNWITSHPTIQIGLNERVKLTQEITKDAIIFGSQHGIISMTSNGLFIPRGTIKDTDIRKTGLNQYTSKAYRFGYWCGSLNSIETLLFSLGITL